MNILDEFLTQYPDGTARVYGIVLDEFEREIAPLETATVSDIIQYQKMIANQSSATIHRKIATLASFYNHLQAREIRADNPTKPIRRVTVDRQRSMVWYTAEEVRELLRVAAGDSRTLALVWVLLHGLRLSEAIGLDVGQYVDGSLRHVVGKGDRSRIVPLAQAAQRAVERYIGTRQHGPLFRGRQGRLSHPTVRRIIGEVSEEAGKRIHPHALRHTFGTEATNKKVPLLVLQELMGHRDPKTTQLYVHLTPSDTREAVEQIYGDTALTVITGGKVEESKPVKELSD